MNKAAFSLEGYKFDQVELNLENVKSDTAFLVDFEPSGVYKEDEKLYILKFVFKAMKDEAEESPIVRIRCIAEFKFEGVASLENIPSFFYLNSIAILFPYVRAFVSTLTLQANIKPILLPTLNLSSLQETLKNNTTAD